MSNNKPKNRAVALVLKNSEGEFLVVKRPNNPNDDIAGVWGLPAVTLKEGESEVDGAHRAAYSKLGIKINLGNKIGESTRDRNTYELTLSDYEATPLEGVPSVPQADTSITQYDECKFTKDITVLYEAARKGSQCTQIFIESEGFSWK